MDVYKSNVSIDPKNNLFEVVREFLKEFKNDWQLQELKFKTFTDGTLLNTLLGCYVKDENEMIVVRINREPFTPLINRQREMAIVQYLGSQDIHPKILATFQNGFCYEYFPGPTLGYEDIYDEQIYRKIAAKVADLHCCKPSLKESNSPEQLFDLAKTFPEKFPDTSCSKFPNGFLTKSFVLEEQRKIREKVSKIDSPIVLCHQDWTPLNILFDRNKNKIMFIDFEFAAYGYQAFDLAFYFCEYCGVKKRDPKLFPDESHRREWLTAYAEKWAKNNGFEVTADYIDKLCQQVDQFIPVVHFVTGIVTTSQDSPDGPDAPGSVNYSIMRFDEYFSTKSNLFY